MHQYPSFHKLYEQALKDELETKEQAVLDGRVSNYEQYLKDVYFRKGVKRAFQIYVETLERLEKQSEN